MAIVDWDLATSTAERFGPTGPRVTLDQATSVVGQLRELTYEAMAHVRDFTGLTPDPDAAIRVVDRAGWAAANLTGLRIVISPLTETLERKAGPLTSFVSAKAAGVQAGALLAYLSGKVLGQYEVFGSDPGQLLLVAPNIVGMERRLGADSRDFRLWVCLHEVTHLTQFTAVPWLREHFFSEVSAFIAAAEPPTAKLADQVWKQLGAVIGATRAGSGESLLDAVQTPEQRAVLDRLTALMTLLEGHAEVVMDGVGPQVIPSVEKIRAGFNQRRRSGSAIEQYLRRLLGIDIKLRQYENGRRFVQAVLDDIGMAGLNRVWDAPGNLPDLAELAEPARWTARVGAAVPGA